MKDGLLTAVTLGTATMPALVDAYNLSVQYRTTGSRASEASTIPIFKTEVKFGRSFNCGKVGHYANECRAPKKPRDASKPNAERSKHKQQPRKETVNIAFGANEVILVTGESDFCPEGRVLLDNQATVSIFRDKSMLENIRQCPPVTICGISNGALKVTQKGNTQHFGEVL